MHQKKKWGGRIKKKSGKDQNKMKVPKLTGIAAFDAGGRIKKKNGKDQKK